jgi:predicted nucleic acid-binding protein
MTLIADTGPLIALAKIKHLDLLHVLFEQVRIPTKVYRELMAKIGEESREIDKALDEFILISKEIPKIKKIEPAIQDLDQGERKVIELAYTYDKPVLLLMDDKLGREAAKQLKLNVTGSIGILLKAKKEGAISNVTDLLRLMRKNGYWFSDEIIREAGKIAGEKN